jgi:Family of unknown function (DUF5706)
VTEPADKALTEDGRKLASKLLTETREELVRADTKAQILFAATGVVISVVIGGILSGHWRPHDLSCRAELVWWIGVAAAGVGVAALVYALWPRIGSAESGRVRYFADIRTYKRRGELVGDLNNEAARKDRDAEQLLALAPIVWKKYIAIKVAIGALSIGAILIVGAAGFG